MHSLRLGSRRRWQSLCGRTATFGTASFASGAHSDWVSSAHALCIPSLSCVMGIHLLHQLRGQGRNAPLQDRVPTWKVASWVAEMCDHSDTSVQARFAYWAGPTAIHIITEDVPTFMFDTHVGLECPCRREGHWVTGAKLTSEGFCTAGRHADSISLIVY